jgi:membrane protein required for colicin V production
VNQVDVILLVLLLPFALRGLFRGLLREAAALIGLVVGVVVAAQRWTELAPVLVERFGVSAQTASIVAPAAIFLAVYLVALLIGAIAHRLARTLFLGPVDRTAGFVFGAAKGAAVCGFALLVAQRLVPGPTLSELIAGSRFAMPLMQLASSIAQRGGPLAAAGRMS